ncbi:hypothetical protein [Streptomyces sp. NPDC001348]
MGLVFIHRGHRKNEAEITRLRAEVTAAKILALQQAMQQVAEPEPDEMDVDDEPVRRKRHLALYLGGLSAAFTWLGGRLRSTWRHHSIATASAIVVTVAATAAAAYHLTA